MSSITAKELARRVDQFVSPETEPDDAIPLVRKIPTEQLAEFFSNARSRLDAQAKEYAATQEQVPNWIGAAHPLAPYEVRRKVELLETEWRMRHN